MTLQNCSRRSRTTLFIMLSVAISAMLCSLAFNLPLLLPAWNDLSAFFLILQDRWLLLSQLAVCAIACLGVRYSSREVSCPAWVPVALAAFVICVCAIGHYLLLCGYAMSRDEQMAIFDSHIFGAGRLTQPLPTLWQAHAEALNLTFILSIARPIAWVSAYLPMNAILRTLIGLVVDPALTGPLFTGLGLLFLWLCSRCLWPEERETSLVAALLYLTSGQVLFAGMTAYAMPAHLTLNLIWLWLFLKARPVADLGALAVAAVATGLHQPLFHPLFALPFLFGLMHDRTWVRALLYAAGYAAISAFWLMWPVAISALVAGPASHTQAAGIGYLSRLVATVTSGDTTRMADMVANLIRFAAWQPVLLLPLMVAGVAFAGRERFTLAMSASIALPIVVMSVILPYQGHGFGYRYLHGALGPAILLAVMGYRHLVRQDTRLRSLLLRTIIASFVVILPLQAYLAHAFYAPTAAVDKRLQLSGADVAIIDRRDAPYALDLVFNRADLSNRPLRLLGDKVDNDLVTAICRHGGRVAMPTSTLFAQIDDYFGTTSTGAAEARFAQLSPKLIAAGCTVERLGP